MSLRQTAALVGRAEDSASTKVEGSICGFCVRLLELEVGLTDDDRRLRDMSFAELHSSATKCVVCAAILVALHKENDDRKITAFLVDEEKCYPMTFVPALGGGFNQSMQCFTVIWLGAKVALTVVER